MNARLPKESSVSTPRLSRRRMLLGTAAGAGLVASAPAANLVGAPPLLARDYHDDYGDDPDDDLKDDRGDDDDGEDRDSLGDEDGHNHDDGDDDETGQEATGDLPAESLEVIIDDDDEDGFNPGTIEIEVGQSITFVNDDDEPHTATSIDWDTGVIEPGESASVTFDEAGTFPYSCQIHPVMTGVVIVHDPEGTPAATPEASPVASPESATPATMAGVTVSIVDFAFDPPELEIPAGSTVTWTNRDTAPHTATSLDDAFDTETLGNGESGSHTFDAPGRFEYQCAFHPSMTGVVVVV